MITFFFKNILTLKKYVMAVFQLGAIVTGIVGSIGGTTFKRQRSSLVIMRKSNGASKSSVLQNVRLGANARTFKMWRSLQVDTQAVWNSAAAKTRVKNKFGATVYLSGVALQRKCQLQKQVLNTNEINPSGFTTDISTITVYTSTLDWQNEQFIFVAGNNYNVKGHIIFYAEFSLNPLNAPSFNVNGSFLVAEINNPNDLNLYTTLLEKYPFLTKSYNLRFYYKILNVYGWTSNLFVQEFEVIG